MLNCVLYTLFCEVLSTLHTQMNHGPYTIICSAYYIYHLSTTLDLFYFARKSLINVTIHAYVNAREDVVSRTHARKTYLHFPPNEIIWGVKQK